MRARVKFFRKGYGFIVTPERESVFVHYSNIIADGYKVLNEGDIVECDIETDSKGEKRAVNVSVIVSIRAVDDVLKERNLYIRTVKNTQDEYGLKKYEVAHRKTNQSQTSKEGMTLLEVAAYAGMNVEDHMYKMIKVFNVKKEDNEVKSAEYSVMYEFEQFEIDKETETILLEYCKENNLDYGEYIVVEYKACKPIAIVGRVAYYSDEEDCFIDWADWNRRVVTSVALGCDLVLCEENKKRMEEAVSSN